MKAEEREDNKEKVVEVSTSTLTSFDNRLWELSMYIRFFYIFTKITGHIKTNISSIIFIKELPVLWMDILFISVRCVVIMRNNVFFRKEKNSFVYFFTYLSAKHIQSLMTLNSEILKQFLLACIVELVLFSWPNRHVKLDSLYPNFKCLKTVSTVQMICVCVCVCVGHVYYQSNFAFWIKVI